MPDRTEERTPDGWTQSVRAQVLYRNADGTFVSREEYVTHRDGVGYGGSGYGG